MSIIGSSANIVDRIKRVIPYRWFSYIAPNRDAILGALADRAAWSYMLIGYARAQSRLATAYGVWLDIFAFDYLGRFLIRNGAADDTFRALIKATILQERVTRNGMNNALTTLTGNAPSIFEPWNANDTGAYSGSNTQSAPITILGVTIDPFDNNFINISIGNAANDINTGDRVIVNGVGGTIEANGVWVVDVFRNNQQFPGSIPHINLRGSSLVHGWSGGGTVTRFINTSQQYGSMGYGVGTGGYGNMNLPGQSFIKVTRPIAGGVPGIGGYTSKIAGYGVGLMEYIGPYIGLTGVTNAMIYQLIGITKPTGTTCWVAIGAPQTGMPKRPMIFNSKNNSQNIVII